MTRIHTTVFILVALIAVVIGLTVSKALNRQDQVNPAQLLDAGIVLLPQGRPMPDVRLIDQNGAVQPVDQLQGAWTVLFFGYTFCPDICPTTLAELRQLKGMLPEEIRDNLRVVLVSVDPARDTPQQLKEYLGFFDAEFRGLTGELADIQKLSNSVGIPFIPGDESKPNYTVDHSGNLALIGPDGRQRGFIRGPLNNAKLAAQLPTLLAGEG
ncbi:MULTISPECIES: SCO family protein [unclassified Pseudomonas]|uniref:SCO family protein n=1 Tax=unclassified Pseudomonas TaxID=196821 RepID=UPI0019E0EA8E|nr:SCO family protein [Pseudomonas sp.]MBF0676883.1 SCO family protein [Pseudomonas sp.]